MKISVEKHGRLTSGYITGEIVSVALQVSIAYKASRNHFPYFSLSAYKSSEKGRTS